MIELKTQQEQDTARRVEELLREYPSLKAISEDRKLTPFQKKLRAAPILKGIRGKIADEQKKIATLDERIAFMKLVAPAHDYFQEYKKLPTILEKNDCSRLHQLISFLKEQYHYMPDLIIGEDPNKHPWNEVTPFVVAHDWAAAFDNATDYNDGAFNLPYPRCAFEFRFSGAPLIVLAGQDDKDHEPNYFFYIGLKGYWVAWSGEDAEKEAGGLPPVQPAALAQIKAICVALDAEVATRRLVRVAEKVNRKREKEGREPFYSYHVIDLNRRYRAANPSHGGGLSQGKKRLHFRRGHWRHYAEFKTWVRWTLVGDPELGFIDKEYRL